jgi:hypothetical protein
MSAFKRIFCVIGAIFCVEPMCRADTLRVQVVDAKTGAPLRATVNAIGKLPRLESALTNDQGVAVLDLPSLQHVFAIVKTSTHGDRCLGEEETKDANLVIRMEPSLRVFGVVRDPDGNPLAQATVKVIYREDPKCRIGFSRPEEVTGTGGEYVLRNVDVSRDFTIVIRHDQYREAELAKSQLLAASAGASPNTKELDITLEPRP